MDRPARANLDKQSVDNSIMRWWLIVLALITVHASVQRNGLADSAPVLESKLKLSGYEFLTKTTKNLQDDDFSNPGMLWVDRGFSLYSMPISENQSCSSCHGNSGEEFNSIAVSYPQIDKKSNELINLETRINLCRERYLSQAPLPYEDDDLLSLTAYITSKSRGETIKFDEAQNLATHLNAGENYFFTRRGQMNLSCSQCHDENWGKYMRGDPISQGHSNGFPTYRFEWQSLGSLHRRFRDCDLGVRAEPHKGGSLIYTQLELYLRSRSDGLTIESPSVRR